MIGISIIPFYSYETVELLFLFLYNLASALIYWREWGINMTTVFGADTGRGHLLFYILFGFILSCGQLFPELRFQHFSSDDGLSSNSVRATIIDQEGFLWVSTTNGLNRYDGYQFKHFFHKSDDPLSLSNSSIHALALDSKGRLWIGTKKGLNRYLPSSGSFKRYMAVNGVVQKNKNEKYGLTNDYISTILATRNGDLYVGTRDGLYRYEESEDRWIRMRPRLELNGTALPNIRVAAMTEAKNGDIWVATYQKNIIIIDPMTGTYKPISMVVNQGDPLVSGHINIIYADSKNRIWIGYYSLGMAYVEPEKERFVHFPYDQTRSRTKGFPSKSVKYILEDSRGVIWLATWANGLIKAIEKQSGFRFESYRKNPEDIHSILDDRVLFLMEDRINQIWASTIRGLELISFDRQKFKWHRHVANRPGITSSDVTSLLEDSLGNVWFGTYNHGISRINHADGSYTHFKYDPKKKNGLKNNGIWSIFEDSQKRIWVGTTRGLHRYVPDSDRFKFIDFKSQGPIFNRNIMIVREDSMGYLWLGTWVGGLNRWHPDSGESIHFKEDLNNPETISFNTVTTIQEDTEGRVWMGSPGDGLC